MTKATTKRAIHSGPIRTGFAPGDAARAQKMGAHLSVRGAVIAAPARFHAWLSRDYLGSQLGAGLVADDLVHYLDPVAAPLLAEVPPDVIREFLEPGVTLVWESLDTGGGVLNGGPAAALRAAGLRLKRVALASAGEIPMEVCYTSETFSRSASHVPARDRLDLLKASRRGAFGVPSANGPAVLEQPDGDTRAELWGAYERLMRGARGDHPIQPALDHETFSATALDRGTLHLVYREGGRVTSYLMVLQDLAFCPWLDAPALALRWPQHVVNQRAAVIATDPANQNAEQGAALVDLLIRLIALDGGNSLLVHRCNNQANRHAPRLFESAFARSSTLVQAERARHTYVWNAAQVVSA